MFTELSNVYDLKFDKATVYEYFAALIWSWEVADSHKQNECKTIVVSIALRVAMLSIVSWNWTRKKQQIKKKERKSIFFLFAWEPKCTYFVLSTAFNSINLHCNCQQCPICFSVIFNWCSAAHFWLTFYLHPIEVTHKVRFTLNKWQTSSITFKILYVICYAVEVVSLNILKKFQQKVQLLNWKAEKMLSKPLHDSTIQF